MNTAITTAHISPSSPASVIRRAFHAVTALARPARQPLTREQLAELNEWRVTAERLHEERARDAARMVRLWG